MAGNASVLEDNSTLSKLDKNLLKVEKAFALISGFAIFSLMVLAVRSVGGREFFEWPLNGYVDWIMQLMPLIAILAVSFAMRDGTHIRMDIFVSQLSGRVLWTFEFITTSVVLILMLLLVWDQAGFILFILLLSKLLSLEHTLTLDGIRNFTKFLGCIQ